jgi:F-type H+-transporting ATPase subunit epsilon
MLSCTFISPTEKLAQENLEGIFLKTTEGERGLLKNHAPLVARLKDNSTIRLKTSSGEMKFSIGPNTFFQFQDNAGIVLTQRFVRLEQY